MNKRIAKKIDEQEQPVKWFYNRIKYRCNINCNYTLKQFKMANNQATKDWNFYSNKINKLIDGIAWSLLK